MTTARHLDAGRELLDHQLVDRDGMLCGNVDDVELEIPDDGGLPRVTALLSGPGVLANRIGGVTAKGLAELHRRLHPTLDGPARIPLSAVDDIRSAIHLNIARDELESNAFEAWFRNHVITHIPGGRRAVSPE